MLAAVAGPAAAQPVPAVPAPTLPPPPPMTAPAAPPTTTWAQLPPAAPPAPLPAATAPVPAAGRPQMAPADGGRPSMRVTFQKPGGADAPQAPQLPNRAQPGTDTNPPVQVRSPSGLADPYKEFRFQSEDVLLRRIVDELQREARERQQPGEGTPPTADYFRPPAPPLLVAAGTPYRPKTLDYPPTQRPLEPGYVVHRRLYFEELNTERYGWDLGFIQPVVSTLHFYKDGLLFPARAATNLFERYDASAGKCLPGSPVPYYLYPPGVDLFGATVGAGAIIGVAAILP